MKRAALLSLASRFALAALVALLVFLYNRPLTGNDLFFDDAADYVRAADFGMRPLWLNTNSVPVTRLLAQRNSPQFRAQPWESLRRLGDNASLRHFHPPFSFYVLGMLRTISPAESTIRGAMSAVSAASCGVLLLLLAGLGVPLPLAALLALLAGVQSRTAQLSTDPSPAVWFPLFAPVALFAVARWLRRGRRGDLLLAAAAFAFCFATVELSLPLLLSLLPALVLVRRWAPQPMPQGRLAWRPLLQAAALFALLSLLLWPGGWLRLGYAESYGVAVLRALLLRDSTWTLPAIFAALFGGHPVLLVLALLTMALAAVLLVRRRTSAASCVFGSGACAMLLVGVCDGFRSAASVSAFLLLLFATAGLLTTDLLALPAFSSRESAPSAHRRVWLVSSAALLLATVALSELRAEPAVHRRPWLRPMIAEIRKAVPPGDTVLVNRDAEALRLYLPGYKFEPTRALASSVPLALERNETTRFSLFEGEVAPQPKGRLLATVPMADGRTATLWRSGP